MLGQSHVFSLETKKIFVLNPLLAQGRGFPVAMKPFDNNTVSKMDEKTVCLKVKKFVNPRTHNGTGILISCESQWPCSHFFPTECSMKRLGRMMCYRFSKPTGYERDWDLELLFSDFCENFFFSISQWT